jgi:hypothetical protein
LDRFFQAIRPRILIELPSELVDPQNPYNAPFYITNEGYLILHSLTIDCLPAMVAFQGLRPASPANPWHVTNETKPTIINFDELAPIDRKPFVCDNVRNIHAQNVRIEGVELEVKVRSSPFSFINWPHSTSRLFEADSAGNGKFRWHELKIGETPHFPKASATMSLRENP